MDQVEHLPVALDAFLSERAQAGVDGGDDRVHGAVGGHRPALFRRDLDDLAVDGRGARRRPAQHGKPLLRLTSLDLAQLGQRQRAVGAGRGAVHVDQDPERPPPPTGAAIGVVVSHK